MARLPQVGGDVGDWGTVLNDFLKTSHKDDGSLRAFISVTDYGAKGDGVTNDTPAIQRTIDAAVTDKRPVFFPAGTYKIESVIRIPSRVQIFGAGYNSLLVSSAPSTNINDPFAFMESLGWDGIPDNSGSAATISDICIEGLRFRFEASLNGSEGPHHAGIRLRNGIKNIIIRKCIFESCSSGVALEGCREFLIQDCVGYSQADASFRAARGYPGQTGEQKAQNGVFVNCWSYNAGFRLDGRTLVGTQEMLIGSAFVITQSAIKLVNCGTVNPKFNAFETGDKATGIVIDGFKSYIDRSDRLGNILIANASNISVRNADLEVHNGGRAAVLVAGAKGQAGNEIGQTNIRVCNVHGFNDYTTANFAPEIVHVDGDSSEIFVTTVSAFGMSIYFAGANVKAIITNCFISSARQQGYFFESGEYDVCNNRAINCGADVNANDPSFRTGFAFANVKSASRVEGNKSYETRTSNRTQLYGYYLVGGSMVWDRNEAANNVNGATQKVNSPTLTQPTFAT